MSSAPVSSTIAPAAPSAHSWLTWVALGLALLASAGSVYLSVGEGLQACTLCFYQRAFAMAALAVLATGLVAGMGHILSLSLLALPVSLAGLGIAVFHVHLELNGMLECPAGLFGLGTAPQQSLAVFLLLSVVLIADVVAANAQKVTTVLSPLLLVFALSAALAVSCLKSNPPLAAPPTEPWDEPLKGCRRPYVPPPP